MCTEQKHGRKSAGSVALSVAALSLAALSVESLRFLGIPRKRCTFYRKRRFLKGAEHIHTRACRCSPLNPKCDAQLVCSYACLCD